MRTLIRNVRRNVVITCVAAAMLGAAAYAAEPAQPPEDPAVAAATLEMQAAELRALADRHDKMGRMHKANAGSSKVNHDNVVRHCDTIAKELRAAAEESESLAREYRKDAGK
jgi:hypothetical protein